MKQEKLNEKDSFFKKESKKSWIWQPKQQKFRRAYKNRLIQYDMGGVIIRFWSNTDKVY